MSIVQPLGKTLPLVDPKLEAATNEKRTKDQDDRYRNTPYDSYRRDYHRRSGDYERNYGRDRYSNGRQRSPRDDTFDIRNKLPLLPENRPSRFEEAAGEKTNGSNGDQVFVRDGINEPEPANKPAINEPANDSAINESAINEPAINEPANNEPESSVNVPVTDKTDLTAEVISNTSDLNENQA